MLKDEARLAHKLEVLAASVPPMGSDSRGSYADWLSENADAALPAGDALNDWISLDMDDRYSMAMIATKNAWPALPV